MARPAAKPRTRKVREARNEELERAIAADPDAVAPYLVYADWLQGQGDPRGELIAVQAGMIEAKGPAFAELKIREQELLAEHAKHFFGPLVRFAAARLTHLEWHAGFVKGIDGNPMQKAAPDFLHHRSAAFLRDVRELSGMKEPPPLLESCASHDGPWPWMLERPRLRELAVEYAETVPDSLSHPRLETLRLGRPAGKLLERLAKASLPRLAHLELGDLDPESIAPAAKIATRLAPRTLSIGLDPFATDERFELGALGPRITRLTMTMGSAGQVQGRLDRCDELRLATYGEFGAFTELPPMPALRKVVLEHPSDQIRYYRAFATSPLAAVVRELEARISKPKAGHALTEGRYPKLESLSIRWDETFTPGWLQSMTLLGADSWEPVTSLAIRPARHLGSLLASPMAARIRSLTVPLDGDGDAGVLVRGRKKLRALETLVVTGDRRLSPAMLRRLFALDVDVRFAPLFPAN